MRRIGVLMGYAESDLEAQAWVTAFVQGFKELDDRFHETDHIGCHHSFLVNPHFAGTC
jgi:hypothetical protein